MGFFDKIKDNIGGIVSGGISGAVTGFMVGGPIGAVVGAGVGAVGGGVLSDTLGGKSNKVVNDLKDAQTIVKDQFMQGMMTKEQFDEKMAKLGQVSAVLQNEKVSAAIDLLSDEEQDKMLLSLDGPEGLGKWLKDNQALIQEKATLTPEEIKQFDGLVRDVSLQTVAAYNAGTVTKPSDMVAYEIQGTIQKDALLQQAMALSASDPNKAMALIDTANNIQNTMNLSYTMKPAEFNQYLVSEAQKLGAPPGITAQQVLADTSLQYATIGVPPDQLPRLQSVMSEYSPQINQNLQINSNAFQQAGVAGDIATTTLQSLNQRAQEGIPVLQQVQQTQVQQQQAQAAIASQMASQRGEQNPALQREALQQQAAASQAIGGQQAVSNIAEQQRRQESLAGLAGTLGQQQFQQALSPAELAQQQQLQQQQLAAQQLFQQQQLGTNVNMQQAQLQQQMGMLGYEQSLAAQMANQQANLQAQTQQGQLQGQYAGMSADMMKLQAQLTMQAQQGDQQAALQLAQMNQQASMANQQTNLQALLAGAGYQQQTALQQGQFGQQANQANYDANLQMALAQYQAQQQQMAQTQQLNAGLQGQYMGIQGQQAQQNAQLMAQLGMSNQQSSLQAALAYQQQEAQRQNTLAQYYSQYGLANQAANNQGAQFNANLYQNQQQFNAQQGQQQQQFNTSAQMQQQQMYQNQYAELARLQANMYSAQASAQSQANQQSAGLIGSLLGVGGQLGAAAIAK